MEWRAHVPQGEHVLPGWEDSVDVAAWLIDPEGLFSRAAMPLAAPVIGSAGIAGLYMGALAAKSYGAEAGTAAPAGEKAKDSCKGKDGCKGKDAKDSCKGHNDCKGKGGCKSGDHGCKGKNSCKGKGGCKSG